jgi:hypothetical protein
MFIKKCDACLDWRKSEWNGAEPGRADIDGEAREGKSVGNA